MEQEPYLLEFYGEECSHCIAMRDVVLRLEKELGVEVKKYEVWHNEGNEKLMLENYKNALEKACGGEIGVPNFYNKKTEKALCGEVDYDVLKKWAQE